MSGAEKVECKMLGGSFFAEITLCEYGETFYACSYISNGVEGNEICSDPKSITVKELQDYVEFSAPVLISYDKNSAKVSVDYKAADGVEVTESGVCFGNTERLSIDNGSVKAVDGVAELIDLETGATYYACSYVKDGDDVAYSKSVSFSVYGIPVVVTGSEAKTDSESAALCGEVEEDCGKEVTEHGFLWCEGAVEILDVRKDTKVKCGAGIGVFNYTLTGLKPNMTYSFCAYAMNVEGTAYGEVVRFTTGVALPVHGKPVTDDITPFTVVLKANVLSEGGESASEQGFYWGENIDVEHKVKCTGSTFSYELHGLSRNTTYYVKSYSINSVGTAYSDVIEFATMPELPTVSTDEFSEIAEYSAVCHGTITDDGGSEITDKGFVYSLTSNPDAETGTKVSVGQGMDQFSLTLSALSPNVTYYVCAYAENPAGISYGDERTFTTKTALPSVGATTLVSSTSSSLTVSASLIDDGGEVPSEVGFYYSTSEEVDPATVTKVAGKASGSSFTAELDGLTRVTKYYVRAYAVNSAGETLSSSVSFTTQAELPVVETAEVTDITDVSATCGGKVTDDGGAEITAKGIVWSTSENPKVSLSTKTNAGNGTGEFRSTMKGLTFSTKYYVRAYATNSAGTSYGDVMDFTTAKLNMSNILDMSSSGTSNSYILSKAGMRRFPTVKGNSRISVGEVISAEVLWESFGTSTVPAVGSLIKSAFYNDGYIVFETPSSFKEGNAVIAAKDASGKILWSWHIWLTDEPGKCVYANNAGTMMDRNLGATSANPGDVGALGLMYQWGRKDPFLGSSNICEDAGDDYTISCSTIDWPDAQWSSSEYGTIQYSIENPTTFIKWGGHNDWLYYADGVEIDNTRWQSTKTIYDPCPPGWRVPDGGSSGIWGKSKFPSGNDIHYFDQTNSGMSFGTKYSSPSTWYPAAGIRTYSGFSYGPAQGYYWSVTPYGDRVCCLNFCGWAYTLSEGNIDIYPNTSTSDGYRDDAYSVRCQKE